MSKLRGINLAIVILSSVIILILGFGYAQISNNKIAKNTYIKNVNIGDLSKEEAKQKIINEYKIDTIKFTYDNEEWNIDPGDIDTSYDINKTVDNAYNVNRQKDIFSNIIDGLKSTFGIKNQINIVVDCNEDKVISQLEKISKNINIDMENARLNILNNNIEIIEEKVGLKVDVESTLENLKKSIQEGMFEENLVVTMVEPEIKTKDLQNINTLIGNYRTVLSDVSPGRVENIKIATQRTSGVLLMPGEEFSYNEHTGLRTVENGYKNATVIVSGEAVQGLGGGVCQVSTTLYNAILYSGLDIVKVSNHSIPSSYVDKGRDAVVSDSGLDFVFKNNYNKAVYIQNYYQNGVITCQVYGSEELKQNIKISTSIDKVSKAPIKEEKDPTLQEGKEKILEKGRDSYTVSTYRIYCDEKGEEVKTEKVATSYYPSKQQVVAIGTKKEEKKPVKEDTDSSVNDNSNDVEEENNNSNDNIINEDDVNKEDTDKEEVE